MPFSLSKKTLLFVFFGLVSILVFTFILKLVGITPRVSAAGSLAGDLNGDGDVDRDDLGILLTNFGGGNGNPADVNSDGRVNIFDLAVLVGNYGQNQQGGTLPTPNASGAFAPWPTAPLCPDSGTLHDHNKFHTLWDSSRGCHYDHEHGENPFIPEVAATFPGFNLFALLGNVGIGHTNPSSPMENTMKHGGFKWQVQTQTPHGCANGFEGAVYGVSAAVIQYHTFGDYTMEFEARIHSALALLRECSPNNPSDSGYMYIVQHVDYGQRVVPYQGTVIPYPNTPNPGYNSSLGPYFTMDCLGTGIVGCRTSRQDVVNRNLNANSIWTSKQSFRVAPSGSPLFALLFRTRDNYQLLDSSDLVYPFTFSWLCSADGGLTYHASPGCRYNNSTSRVHEITGVIPAQWDNLSGFDSDPRVGRITATGYVTRFGQLNTSCTTTGIDCHPIKLVQAFVGKYGAQLIDEKINQFSFEAQPERDIYFCGASVCNEGDPGAMSSGWIGQEN